MKLVLLILVLISVQGCCCLNSTIKVFGTNATISTTTPNENTSEIINRNIEIPEESVVSEKNLTNLNKTDLEMVKIFSNNVNNTSTTESINITSVNSVKEIKRNNTFSANTTIIGEAVASLDVLPFRLPNWAAITAAVCLVSGVIGYISCISYRRFLQRKYGNSQILIGEDIYDTSDLRNFEI